MLDHYRQVEESKRLFGGAGELGDSYAGHPEQISAAAPATVFDIGGAAGVHAFGWLSVATGRHLLMLFHITWSKLELPQGADSISTGELSVGDARTSRPKREQPPLRPKHRR